MIGHSDYLPLPLWPRFESKTRDGFLFLELYGSLGIGHLPWLPRVYGMNFRRSARSNLVAYTETPPEDISVSQLILVHLFFVFLLVSCKVLCSQ